MITAKFVERKNRFTALVELEGQVVPVHVANSGRLKELFQTGHDVYLVEAGNPLRATRYDLSLVKYNGNLVSIDARVPNRVVAEAINGGLLEAFRGFSVKRREVNYGSSRLDFLLENTRGESCYLEVKSVTLVVNGIARFPDAPTERGSRHLQELMGAVKEGTRAAVVFLIQRNDAVSFSPNESTDPVFAAALRMAAEAGVEVFAYTCRIIPGETTITGPVPVIL